MQELKKIGVLSAVKIATLFGLIAGIFMAISNGVLYTFVDATTLAMMGIQGTFTLSAALTGMVFQIVLSALLGLISAALYNLFAKYVGGVKVELKDSVKKTFKKK
jgi:hypothetical protein